MLNTKIQQDAINQFEEKIKTGEYILDNLNCPLCDNSKSTLLYNRDRYGIKINTVICDRCGLLRSDPYYTQSTLNKYYQNEYRLIYTNSQKATDEFFEDEINTGKNILKFISKSVNIDFTNMKVYEIGAGAGGILIPFKEIGADVYGCDLGSEYIEYGIKKGINMVHGNSSTLKQFGKADLIILNHVLEHFREPVQELGEILSLLNDGGYIYISVPGVKSHLLSYGTFKKYLQNAHAFHFTLATLNMLMMKFDYGLVIGNEKVQSLFTKKESIKMKDNILILKLFIFTSIYLPFIYIPYLYMLRFLKFIISLIKKYV